MATKPLEDAVDRTEAPVVAGGKGRLSSLDVFRGIVILAMLIVNNLGDGGTTGYFWKHADWFEPWMRGAFAEWWREPSFGGFPLFRECTLADYVMPSFMMIIGLAIPYSVAASKRRGVPAGMMWMRTVKRAAMLVLLGWVICYFRDQFAGQVYGTKPFSVSLGMDVLQCGVGYLVARVLYELPVGGRIVAAGVLFIWHWGFLRFYPQGGLGAGVFREEHNAVGYAYAHWGIWREVTVHVWRVTMGWAGMLSVPPAAGMMLIGTVAGDWVRRAEVGDQRKVRGLILWGVVLMVVGALWGLDLPFNKPRWTPCYLCWVGGVDLVVLGGLYVLVDIWGWRGWTYPFVVFGSNAIAVYFLSIMGKILFLYTPRVVVGGERMSVEGAILRGLKHGMGNWAGGWVFTIGFIGVWWVLMDQMYRRKWFWKL